MPAANRATAPSQFSARFPRNREDLESCFAYLRESAYYVPELKREEVVAAWEKMLMEGTGDIILENPAYTARLKVYADKEKKFICRHFSPVCSAVSSQNIMQGNS